MTTTTDARGLALADTVARALGEYYTNHAEDLGVDIQGIIAAMPRTLWGDLYGTSDYVELRNKFFAATDRASNDVAFFLMHGEHRPARVSPFGPTV